MKLLFLLLIFVPVLGVGQTFHSDGSGEIPEMTIRIVDDFVFIKGASGFEYKAQAISQHAEIYFNVPSECECDVKPGEYSGVTTKEFLELFTPYFGVLPIVQLQP